MAITARFVRGSQTLDLVYPYTGLTGFTPPPVNPEHNIASGTSANLTTGGTLVSTRYADRRLVFGVRIQGTSKGQIENAARHLVSFVSVQSSEPLYFEFKDNDLPDPLWGQFAAPLRYEVITAEASYNRDYLGERLRETMLVVTVSLTVKPFALGQKQRLATASGCIMEDVFGMPDGQSRGLIVLPASVNKFTNPVFGYSTWNNGWAAAGATLLVEKNTNSEFLLPGTVASAKLTRAGAHDAFYQVINAGNTNAHVQSFYAKKPDGSAVTSADIAVYYSGNVASSYRYVGDGWYRVSAIFSTASANRNVGVYIPNAGTVIYVSGFQLEDRSFITPLITGDMLGCAWSGTAHASTSVSAAGVVTLPVGNDVMTVGEGSICMALKFQVGHDTPNDIGIWDARDGTYVNALRLGYAAADDKFYLRDGTNTVSSAAQSFSPGDTVRVYCTWGRAGLALSVNGAAPVTGTYTINTTGPKLFIGSNYLSANQASATIMGITPYNYQLSAAEIAAIDAAASVSIANDHRVDYIPWLWTKDGDNITDNADSGSYQNWGIVSGVAGNVEADTYYKGIPSGAGPSDSIYISRFDMPHNNYINPTFLTSGVSATAISVDTNITPIAYVTLDMRKYRMLAGRDLLFMVKGNEDGSNNLQLQTSIDPGALPYDSSELLPALFRTTGTTDYSVDSSPLVHVVEDVKMHDVFGATRQVTARLSAKRTSGGAADFNYGSAQIFTSPILLLRNPISGATYDGILINDVTARGLFNSGAFSFRYDTVGEAINVLPGNYNVILSMIGLEGVLSGPAQSILWTIYIIPRWSLI